MSRSPLLLVMSSLCCFSKQGDARIGWSDAISANPLMHLKPDKASFRVEFDQALNAHITRVIENPVSSLKVPERCYNTFCPCEGSHIILGVDWVSQECIWSAFI